MQVSFGPQDTDRQVVPQGTYKMVFDGFSDPIEVNKFEGDGTEEKIVARFKVTDGQHQGGECAVWCKPPKGNIHPKSNLAKVIQWVTGAPLPSDGGLDLKDLVGTTGSGVVSLNQNGNPQLVAFQAEMISEF